MIQSGIYIIVSTIDCRLFYVGSSVNLKRREIRHFWELRSNRHHNGKLQRYFCKYGANSLLFEPIYYCDRSQLLQLEQAIIDDCHPYFNLNPVAGSRLGAKLSARSKNKISMKMKKIHRLSYPSSLVKQKL